MTITISIKFDPRDLWVGLYWTRKPVRRLVLYICILPALPIVVTIHRKLPSFAETFDRINAASGHAWNQVHDVKEALGR